jgi:hypothetical protein
VSIQDVTIEVLNGVTNENNFTKIINDNIIKLQNQQSNPNYKSVIKPFYYGNKYYMITSKTYKDVRLVGAPPSSMGKFGGDTDNWVWPRHTCDFSVFRIYANSDNEPSEISDENQPYNAPVSLDINISGIKENDFSMIFGFPGKTEQYLTSNAVNNYLEKILPARIEMRKNSLKFIDAAMDLNELNYIKYASKQSRISNAYKKWIGQDLGLRKKEAVKIKKLSEDKWLSLNQDNPQILNELFKVENNKITYQLAYSLFIEMWYYGPEVIRFSNGFRKLSVNDDFENNVIKKRKSIKNYFKNYDRNVDINIFKSLLPIYLKHLDNSLESQSINNQINKYSNVNEFVEYLFDKSKFSKLESVEKLLNMNEKGLLKALEKDPLAKFSDEIYNHFRQEILPIYRGLEKQHNLLMKKYLRSIMESDSTKTFFADANSTIRLTYGKVEGSKPRDGMSYNWFTTIDGIVEKYNTGASDFEVPERLLELHRQKKYGRYGSNGNLNICFLGSNHTTGGNSGSPALDAKGSLIGINFDRTWESTMSDILFDKDICRNIMVDIRYVLWVIDIYAGAGHLVEEMNLIEN